MRLTLLIPLIVVAIAGIVVAAGGTLALMTTQAVDDSNLIQAGTLELVPDQQVAVGLNITELTPGDRVMLSGPRCALLFRRGGTLSDGQQRLDFSINYSLDDASPTLNPDVMAKELIMGILEIRNDSGAVVVDLLQSVNATNDGHPLISLADIKTIEGGIKGITPLSPREGEVDKATFCYYISEFHLDAIDELQSRTLAIDLIFTLRSVPSF